MAPNAKGGYGTCVVYAIWNLIVNELCYVGSTAVHPLVRMGQHYSKAVYKRSSDFHAHMWDTGLGSVEAPHFEMRIVEGPFECGCQKELTRREEAHRVLLNPRFNMRKAWLRDQDNLDRFVVRTPHASRSQAVARDVGAVGAVGAM